MEGKQERRVGGEYERGTRGVKGGAVAGEGETVGEVGGVGGEVVRGGEVMNRDRGQEGEGE